MHKNHSDFTDKNYSHEAQDLYLFAINDEQLYTIYKPLIVGVDVGVDE
jgi:hypothetical protein